MALMFFSLLFFIFIGLILGVITGLIPGLHVNTLALIALTLSVNSFKLELSIMLVSMSLMHSFVDFIPSILLGLPEEESFLALLPGHRMFLKGEGLKSIDLTIFGGFFAGLTVILLSSFIFLFLIKGKIIESIIPFILIFVLMQMILESKTIKEKIFSLLIVFLSSITGLIVLENQMFLHPLFVLVSGFFGLSAAIITLNSKNTKVRQKNSLIQINIGLTLKACFYGLISGLIVAISPGITSNGAALIVKKLVKKMKTNLYLMILGASNTVNFILSFIVLIAWQKTRTGTALALKHLIELNESNLMLIIAVTLISLPLAAITTRKLSKLILKRIHLINLKKISALIIIFLVSLTFYLSSFLGLIALITAASIALLAVQLKVKRSNCMAFLIIPVLLRLLI